MKSRTSDAGAATCRGRARSGWSRPASCCPVLAVSRGCRQDMHNQPRYRPLRESDVLRQRVERAAARRGHDRARHAADRRGVLHRQERRDAVVDELPFPMTNDVLDRGEERFNIYCTPCHGRTGERQRHGRAARLSDSRRRSTSIGCAASRPGYFFDVMTNGFGAMPDYRAQITPRDRWNIVAYIRALQLSQHATRRRRARAAIRRSCAATTAGGGRGANRQSTAVASAERHADSRSRISDAPGARDAAAARARSSASPASWSARIGAVAEPRPVPAIRG